MNNRRASERRSQQRVPVQIRSPAERNTVTGIALNLSEGGVLVELPKRPQPTASFVVVTLEVGGATNKVQAVVQRSEDVRGRSRVALRFIDLGEFERNALRMHLRL